MYVCIYIYIYMLGVRMVWKLFIGIVCLICLIYFITACPNFTIINPCSMTGTSKPGSSQERAAKQR